MGEETIYETTPAPKIMRPKWESTTQMGINNNNT